MHKRTAIAAFLVLFAGFVGIGSMMRVENVDGALKIESPAPRAIVNSLTIEPLRTIPEKLGAVVQWNEEKRSMEITTGVESTLVNIRAEQDGVPIRINGKYVGKSPVQKRLAEGDYMITAKPEAGVGSIRYIKIKGKKQALDIAIPLENRTYEQFLDKVMETGYKVVPVEDFYQGKVNDKLTIVMRHDVDLRADLALKMAKAEYERNMRSTYYFRWLTAEPDIISEIKSLGHEIGIHYETLATYAKEKGLTSASEVTAEVQAELRQLLKEELREFEEKFGDIQTIASHGAPENQKLKLRNYDAIMKGEDPSDYGLLGTAYGKVHEELLYLTDAGGIWDPMPYETLERGEEPLYILVHPEWWSEYTF